MPCSLLRPCASLSLRSVAAALLIASLLLCVSPAAFAGTWALTLTSSSHSQTVNGVTTAGSWPPNKGTPGPSITLPPFTVPAPASVTPAVMEQAKASLTVTVTGTWTPVGSLATDPVPNTIVSVVSQSGSNGSTGQPLVQTANDGYSDPTGVASSSGTHYLQETTSPFTITVSPTASVSATATVTAVASASAGGITITTYIPSVTLGGTTPDSSGNANILVGQGCTASLPSISTLTGLNASLKATYQWSVTGTTFQDWEPTTSQVGTIPANPNASYYLGGPGVLTNATAHWYWNDLGPKPTPETVSCTATVTPPAGQGSPFPITATQKVTVYVPTVTAKNVVGLGYVGLYKDTSTLYVYAGPTPLMKNNGQEEGSTWITSVALPTAPTFSGTGKWGYVQIITPGEYLIVDGGTTVPGSENGVTELDGVFPYFSSSYPLDGQLYNNGDSPGLPTASYVMTVKLTDAFQTYLMFLPPVAPSAPADDVRWVALQESDWSTNLDAARPSSGSWGDFPLAQSVGPVNLGFDFKVQNTPPQWTHKSAN